MNWPNRLSILRIVLVPLFLVILFTPLPYADYLATAVFTIAAITDGLDGYLARSRNEVTRLGKLLDPLADKLLVTSALVSLVDLDLVSSWVVIIIIGREFAVTGLRTMALNEGLVIAASTMGKIKTISQVVAVILLLQKHNLTKLFAWPLAELVLYLALILTVVSGIEYFWRVWDKIDHQKPHDF